MPSGFFVLLCFHLRIDHSFSKSIETRYQLIFDEGIVIKSKVEKRDGIAVGPEENMAINLLKNSY